MQRAIVVILLVAVCGCARHHIEQQAFGPAQVRPLAALKSVSDPRELNNVAGYLEQGESIPLRLSLESEWLEIRQDHVDLVAKQRIYFRLAVPEDMPEERMEKILDLDADALTAMSDAERAQLFKGVMLYLSSDAVHWARLNDPKGLKEVFDIKGGTFTASMGMNDTEGAWVALTVKAVGKN